MTSQNRNLFIIAIIAIVNALGYGIIIPILYSYSQRFGLSDFQNGLLFSIFSVCQFFATPLIGRLSDKYGRRPLLLISLAGTAISFFLMAFAQAGWVLFVARALDGITAGNLPVASAVISDTTAPKDRAKGFGIIGASFGFGFIFGPAISAFTVGINPSIPFIIAGSVSVVAVLLTALLLPETNVHIGQVIRGKIFDFGTLLKSVIDPNVGQTLLLTFLYSLSFAIYIYAFQPFAVKILHMNPTQISIVFTIFGVMGLIAQIGLIGRLTKRFGERYVLLGSLCTMVATFFLLYISRMFIPFLVISIVHSLANSFVNPIIQTLLSKEVDEKSQGSIMGINASYQSVGMIVGPIIGGAIATLSIPMPLLAASGVMAICAFIAFKILHAHFKKLSEFSV